MLTCAQVMLGYQLNFSVRWSAPLPLFSVCPYNPGGVMEELYDRQEVVPEAHYSSDTEFAKYGIPTTHSFLSSSIGNFFFFAPFCISVSDDRYWVEYVAVYDFRHKGADRGYALTKCFGLKLPFQMRTHGGLYSGSVRTCC